MRRRVFLKSLESKAWGTVVWGCFFDVIFVASWWCFFDAILVAFNFIFPCLLNHCAITLFWLVSALFGLLFFFLFDKFEAQKTLYENAKVETKIVRFKIDFSIDFPSEFGSAALDPDDQFSKSDRFPN